MWNSQDSRYLGLIPEEFIIGKASCILSSRDPETKAYRWKRFLKKYNPQIEMFARFKMKSSFHKTKRII